MTILTSFYRSLSIGVGVVSIAFLTYALYFDYRRRSSTDYKSKIRLKRKMQSQAQNSRAEYLAAGYAGMQHFFLQEVQLGEEQLLSGFVQEGIRHLANAIVMCNKPEQVMTIFRRTLAEEHYLLLEHLVPEARKNFIQSMENISIREVQTAEDSVREFSTNL